MMTNDDVVRPQACTCYVGHEHIAIVYCRLGRSYYPEVTTRPKLHHQCVAFVSLAMRLDRSRS